MPCDWSTGAASDAGHVHEHGAQAGGTLHADAVAGVSSGFLSAAGATLLAGVQAQIDAKAPTASPTFTGTATAPVFVATTRIETPTIGAGAASQHALPTGTGDLLSTDSSLAAAKLTGTIDDARLSAAVQLANDLIGSGAQAQLNLKAPIASPTFTGTATAPTVAATTRVETPTIGTSAGAQHALPAGTGALLSTDSSLDATKLTGSIADARLSSGVQLASDLAGSGAQAQLDGKQPLDADLTALAALGATAGMLARTGAGAFAVRTLTGTANKIAVSNGTGGAGDPTISLPSSVTVDVTLTAGTSVVAPRLDAPASEGVIVNATTGNAVIASVNNTAKLTIAGAGMTSTVPLAMGSQKITDVAPGTATGEALCYPWIGSASDFATLGGTFTITHTDGTYDDTGLQLTLPSTGTYLVWYQARSNLLVTAGAGAIIVTRFYDSTNGAAITDSEQIGAAAATINVSWHGSAFVMMKVAVSGATTIKLQAKIVNNASTYTLKTINWDVNGKTSMGYAKTNST